MKVSYNWLQKYFEEKLPSPEALAELLTFHVFEIESVEKTKDEKDTILDVKVLPDRACYALSHKGIAYEIGAILNLQQKLFDKKVEAKGTVPKITIENSDICVRYMARTIEGVTVGDSPAWLKEKLQDLGQRSINNIVDAANYILLDTGQPLHAFDSDKLVGTITVRFAKAGEKIITLDEKEVALDENILIIADNDGPLAIAGIKGGKRARVTESTKNILIESANFDATLIRKTSTKIGIRTDASKRYENAVSPEYTLPALEKLSTLIETFGKSQAISEIIDMYPRRVEPWIISIAIDYICERLGISLDHITISEILNRLHLEHIYLNNTFEITIPSWRADLTIPEDIVEEVGRIYGYEKIPPLSLPQSSFSPKVDKKFYYENKLRDILLSFGFSEVYTYTFVSKGDITLEKPLASDKAYLRTTLTDGIQQAIDMNSKNADLLALDQIKIFEIGTLFSKSGESTHLVAGLKNIKKTKKKEQEELAEVLAKISEELGVDLTGSAIVEATLLKMNVSKLLEKIPEPQKYEDNKLEGNVVVKKYQPFSMYPFSVRDIAVFTPEGTEEKTIRDIIEKNADNLLVRLSLFDRFEKDFPDGSKKVSYGFRLVLQSYEKTLSEEEITGVMNAITNEMNSKEGWQVR